MILLRALIVVGLLFGVALARRLYAQWRHRVHAEQPAHPLVPPALLDGAERTWVVFTTPWCATCGPLEERIRRADPGARVVEVDAARERFLAEAFSVRTAPTVLLADGEGRVKVRLVGPSAVEHFDAAV